MQDLLKWKVELLRVSGFLTPGGQLPERNWWQEVTGREPDKIEKRVKTGRLTEFGDLEIGRLILGVQPVRMDWGLQPIATGDDQVTLENCRAYGDVLPTFKDYMQRWLNIAPPVGRLALGMVLFHPVASLDEGYRELSGYLMDTKPDASAVSDFFYQINRPRPSRAIEGVVVNRLSKWSCANYRSVEFMLSAEGVAVTGGGALFATRLELDINNKWDGTSELEKGKLPGFLAELVELASEIVTKGESV